MQGRGKRELPEKTRRPVASSRTIPTCEYPDVSRPGIEPGAFRMLVDSLDWMDKQTKKATLEKSSAIKSFIGFPDWLLDEKELNSYYEGVGIHSS
ncbi:hypothetical protein PR048_003461 [Dryococelus australis]|uniref:Peptidase M13 N-terminal domain-containing protein n=1 Tax=Dryococelus australis TaxID=614101 RepID=A0ABQ9IP41_9NEOP|nr:hypothetical protein PR048_003461 [Dryococelus australis]